ncbi:MULTISPECIES: helix-turn-helix domain-containing protein [unclassified Micromonospora]|uniref:AraC-like ligand-binding domain-containing protein n=1 Tax=unclassified Micromonospora TaxID=2617518 RepID=UPI003318031A
MTTLRVEAMDTTWVPPADRFPLWLDMAARVAAPIACTSDHADDFQGRARMVSLGGIELTRLRYQSLIGRRTARMIRQEDPEVYQLALTLAGDSAINARRRESTIPVGDLTLIDWSRPHTLTHAGEQEGNLPAAAVTAVIPRTLLPLDTDRVDRLAGELISGTEGPGALLAQHLHHISRHPEQFHATQGPRLAEIVLSLISMTLATRLDTEHQLPGEVRRQALVSRVRDFVERHLADTTLGPQTIADAHHVSVRTLHRLFAAEEETVTGLIRQRRLDRCRHDLGNPLLRHQPAHRIARRWGFTDRAHFSRAFRAAYGTGPQAYRELHALPSQDPGA